MCFWSAVRHRDLIKKFSSVSRAIILCALLAGGILLTPSGPALAQCDDVCLPNEVVVDEGPTWCRCRDRQKFQQCISDADAAVKTDRRNCAYIVQGVFGTYGESIGDTSQECVRRYLAEGLRPDQVFLRCIFNPLPVGVLDHAKTKMNECLGRVAQNRRMREANCRKEED
jgi:hypothetical protein